MPVDYSHVSPSEAISIQKEIRNQVNLVPLDREIKTIAGADISFNKHSDTVYAGIIVLSYPELEIIESATTVFKTTFPYVPGLLAFREVPALQQVWQQLNHKPDALILDGHGIAHPRRVGVASHFGILEGVVTIGCAKSLLAGSFKMPENVPFSTSPMVHREETIGTALRTKVNCKPVFISPGHLITLDESVDIVKHCTRRYRIPEPTRLAHLLVNKVRKEHK
ncbi:deoxyribonuclease V [Polluticoccus soli]|uniref:deoxyribonuclease V n=1 Tax=Polluticoccus soli TaxID=3034150 RepID=UPI0023E27CA1|nr:deoxyribonuclease V [Flavipsychrobacter sp. JY13-12]